MMRKVKNQLRKGLELRKRNLSSLFPIYQGPKITGIAVYSVSLPLHEGSYKWSGGNEIVAFDSTVVRIVTDKGIEGFGENTPLGSAYLPAYAEGTRTGIRQIAPSLLGMDPTRIHDIYLTMDKCLKGHPYVKSALDMACWDITGKVAGLPVCELLGGRFGTQIPLYRAISQDSPENMAQRVQIYVDEGYRKFQLKVGGSPQVDIERIRAVRRILDDKTRELTRRGEENLTMPLFCDANTGWKMHEALRVVNAVKDLDVYIEQPCLSYDECLSVRRLCPLPMILDECVDSLSVLSDIAQDKAADAINLKISKVGGITKAKTMRDFAVSAGIPMNIEDTWGGDIVTAAIAHLAHSTPPEFLLCSTDFNSYGPVSIAKTSAVRKNGFLAAPVLPGLGVDPFYEVLNEPLFVIGKI